LTTLESPQFGTLLTVTNYAPRVINVYSEIGLITPDVNKNDVI